MPPSDLERIFAALEDSGARYLVVGGVAVVLHGHLRFTADLDLALALDDRNVERALNALEGLGYRPRAPVALRAFADPGQRALWSAELPGTEIDLFVEDPLPFEAGFERRLLAEIGELRVSVASLADLIEMKRRAGRAQDLDDVRELEAIARETEERRRG